MKKYLAFLMVMAALVVMMTGCSSFGDNTTTATEAPATTVEATDAPIETMEATEAPVVTNAPAADATNAADAVATDAADATTGN